MTEITESGMATITSVIDRMAGSYTFGYYEVDDIKQEAFIHAMDAWEKWDRVRPFQNFLAKHLKHRLLDLIRNKYQRANSSNDAKRKLMDPGEFIVSDATYEDDPLEDMIRDEDMERIRECVDQHTLNDFYRMANGVTLPPSRKSTVINTIREVIDG